MKNKTLITTALFTLLFLATAGTAKADQYGCNGAYGQYNSCPTNKGIIIDKFVSKPTTASISASQAEYVDNLSESDAKFGPSQVVFFKLKVKNTSNVKLTNVEVKDFMPDFVSAVEGPGGFDSATRSISFNAGDFNANEEKVYYIKAQVNAQNNLPKDKTRMCVMNRAQASAEGMVDDDTAQFCIEKQVLGVPAVPATGPEMGIALFGLEAAALAVGLKLRKKN